MGDVVNGQALFEAAPACVACHQPDRQGTATYPDITAEGLEAEYGDDFPGLVEMVERMSSGGRYATTTWDEQDHIDVAAFLLTPVEAEPLPEPEPEPTPEPEPVPEPALGDAAAGETLYQATATCVGCHGAGRAGVVGPALTASALEAKYDGDFGTVETLVAGMAGSYAPTWTATDIENVTAYLLTE